MYVHISIQGERGCVRERGKEREREREREREMKLSVIVLELRLMHDEASEDCP